MQRSIIALALLFSLVFSPTLASAQTTGELLAKINGLTSRVNELVGQVSVLSARVSRLEGSKPTPTIPTIPTIGATLGITTDVAPPRDVSVNTPRQFLGTLTLTAGRSAVAVSSAPIVFGAKGGFADGDITSVTLEDSRGTVVAGPVDMNSGNGLATFTDTFTVALGTNSYRMYGRISKTVSDKTEVSISTKPASWKFSSVTGGTATLASTADLVNLGSFIVRSSSLGIVFAPDVDRTVVPGAGDVKAGTLVLQATGASEDIRLSGLYISLAGIGDARSLTRCQLFDGPVALNTSSNIVNPLVGAKAHIFFGFDQALTVQKGTQKNIGISCALSGAAVAGATYQWTLSADDARGVNASGITTGNALPVSTSGSGPTLTVAGSSLSVSTDSSTPLVQTVSAGSTNVNMGVVKVRAVGEAMHLNRLGLHLAQGFPADIASVAIMNGPVQVGSVVFAGNSLYATSTFPERVLLPQDTDITLTIRASFAKELQKDRSSLVINAVSGVNTQATGLNSGRSINASGSTAFPGIILTSGIAPSPTPPSPTPVSVPAPAVYWPFDSSFSGSTVVMVPRNNPTLVPGHSINAAQFTPRAWLGGDDGDVLRSQDLTIATWINLAAYPADGRAYIINKGLAADQKWISYQLYVDGTGKLVFGLQNKTLNQYPFWTSAQGIKVGAWNHIAVSAQRTPVGYDVRFYVNGVAIPSTLVPNGYNPNTSVPNPNTPVSNANTFSIEYSTEKVYIGAHAYTDSFYLTGSLDNLAFYKQALSEDQIRTLAGVTRASVSNPVRSSLVANIASALRWFFSGR